MDFGDAFVFAIFLYCVIVAAVVGLIAFLLGAWIF